MGPGKWAGPKNTIPSEPRWDQYLNQYLRFRACLFCYKSLYRMGTAVRLECAAPLDACSLQPRLHSREIHSSHSRPESPATTLERDAEQTHTLTHRRCWTIAGISRGEQTLDDTQFDPPPHPEGAREKCAEWQHSTVRCGAPALDISVDLYKRCFGGGRHAPATESRKQRTRNH